MSEVRLLQGARAVRELSNSAEHDYARVVLHPEGVRSPCAAPHRREFPLDLSSTIEM